MHNRLKHEKNHVKQQNFSTDCRICGKHVLCLQKPTSGHQELKGEIFDLLFNSAEINKFAPKERSEYIKQMITIRDIVNQMATAEEKGEARGLAKGRAEGLAEGEANAMRKMAVKMLAAGEKVSRVSEFTGLPLEEVTALQEG